MKRINSHILGIDQGDKVLFSDYEDGGPMWTGTDARESRTPIAFSEPFKTPPTIHLSMSMFDVDRVTNMRGDLHAENITVDGFDIVFRTWSDSRVARIRAAWMAIGELPSEDDWELY